MNLQRALGRKVLAARLLHRHADPRTLARVDQHMLRQIRALTKAKSACVANMRPQTLVNRRLVLAQRAALGEGQWANVACVWALATVNT